MVKAKDRRYLRVMRSFDVFTEGQIIPVEGPDDEYLTGRRQLGLLKEVDEEEAVREAALHGVAVPRRGDGARSAHPDAD